MDQKIKNLESRTSGLVPLFVIAFILNVAVVALLFLGDQLPLPPPYWVKNVISVMFLAFLCFGILQGVKALTEKKTNTDRLCPFSSKAELGTWTDAYLVAFAIASRISFITLIL